jgi:2-oxoisovalerate dehydrogenase E2 component (dihydrolipoyl transacylase)
MATTIRMPQLGETVTEGTVARWLKQPGDAVAKYEAFVEVSTDKVNAEVPSPVSGTIRELIVAEGETVPTGAPIALIDEIGAPAGPPGPAAVAAPPAFVPAAPPAPPAPAATNGHNGTRVSPAVRRLAREHAVDVAAVAGTGAGGRVTAADIVAAATVPAAPTGPTAPAPPPLPFAPTPAPEPPAPARAAVAAGDLLPLSPSRRLIARRMVESKQTAPHAWVMVEVDVSSLWAWRSAEKEAFERAHGVKLTLLPFFMHAAVEALRAFPLMNASFTDAGIAVHKHVHLGIAIAAEGGLVVPVVRNAEERSIRGIAVAAGALIDKARRGKLDADDLAGGTFTVNNNGASGSVLSAPILVPGQAGIVTMEAVVKRPVVINDAIAIRSMMNVCLSLDHRVVDGAIAIGFLADLKQRLEAMGPSGSL